MYIEIPVDDIRGVKEEQSIRISYKEETGTIMLAWKIRGRFTPARFVFPAKILNKITKALSLLSAEITAKTE